MTYIQKINWNSTSLTLTFKYMKKILKKKSQISKLFDEYTFISPACAWVNKLPKNKLK